MEETTKGVYRILDANLNRLKEGIRVVEDTARYLHNDEDIALSLKNLRHKAKLKNFNSLLRHRDSIQDVLKKTISSEINRDELSKIVLANFKRAQESSRVLEEYLKHRELFEFGESEVFKCIRYELYELEKKFILKYFEGK
ncbi:thiamine-phosphate pyrophosphorylase [Helicobacter cappadocius]|uniref:Thiamine-phosphate pyrophosphorylase n=1 Tax=Helicobacter cappadocius TaxID=3063998 RepID=A0AA90PXD5_9HELI|nr:MULTISPECIES: thiamine-phosphate pyrophosphorylase [unclassified Helicobacter]MDO7252456.1 thiamine-phosphate pyrophosphorylase [Helicobacter sp. faydin-H75]MDP2538323.1 thiamine-phosphate pyrophosphorylase [Helicobacter sp. faydin-H76]